MKVNPEELVELKDHGLMKLQYAVARAMLLLPAERSKATIVRQSKPSILRFKAIKDLSLLFARLRPSRPRKGNSSKRSSSSSQSRTCKSTSRSRVALFAEMNCRWNPAIAGSVNAAAF